MSSSYLDPHLEINSQYKLMTKLYINAMTSFSPLSTFLFHSGNIPLYKVFISQLIFYFIACHKYTDFLFNHRLLSIWSFDQGYVDTQLKSLLQKLYGRHYGSSLCIVPLTNLLVISQFLPNLTFYEQHSVSSTAEYVYYIGGSYRCSQFSVVSEFLICFCLFVRVFFFY